MFSAGFYSYAGTKPTIPDELGRDPGSAFFFIGPPLPRGVPGEGPDCHLSKGIVGFGPIPVRILEFLFLFWP